MKLSSTTHRRIAIVLLLTALVAFTATVATAYHFDRNVHSHIGRAAQAGDPATMHAQLVEAKEGLDEVSHDDGQYAWFIKTARTDTAIDHQILQSYIDRADRLKQEENTTRVSIGIEDMRSQMSADGPGHGMGVDTLSRWHRTNPVGAFSLFWVLYLVTGLLWYGYSSVIEEEERRGRR